MKFKSLASWFARILGCPGAAAVRGGATLKGEPIRSLGDSAQQPLDLIACESTYENAGVGLTHVGLDGRWLRLNRAACTMLGYAREELIGEHYKNVLHPDDVAESLNIGSRIRRREISSFNHETRYLRKGGAVLWAKTTGVYVGEIAGETDHVIIAISDITQRVEAQDALRKSEADLAAVLDNSQDLIWAVDADYRLTRWNTAFSRSAQPVRSSQGRRIVPDRDQADEG
jgi:PAS domain S-box-containing protein